MLVQMLGISSSFANEKIRLTNGEWSPWLSESLKHYGVVSHIVGDAFALGGVEVTYGFFPWPRSLSLAQHGKWDGSVVWYYTEERTQHFIYSDPVVKTSDVFFHLKDFSFDWNSVEDLKGLEIGAVKGVFYFQEFEDAEKAGKITTSRAPSFLINVRKLLKGRIDVFPMAVEVAQEIFRENLSKEETAKITYHPKNFGERTLHVLFSKKVERNKKMKAIFDHNLKRLKESGKYDQYLQNSLNGKYLLSQ